jgi:hypothetical protein
MLPPLLFGVALVVALLVPVANASVAAGEVALVTGQAQASSKATLELRSLQRGDPVYAGDIVTTGANTYANLKFTDGSFILLRPNSRFEIEGYVAPAAIVETELVPPSTPPAESDAASPPPPVRPPPSAGQAFFRLLKGGFRAVSGLIGRADPDEYRVSSPVATIGIRGTDYLAVTCDAACASDPVVIASMRPGCSNDDGQRDRSCDAPLPEVRGGIIVGVITGLVVVVNANGEEFEVRPGQYLLTLTDGTQILLSQIPDFLRINPIPNPTELCES